MAIAILSEDKYRRAEAIVAKEGGEVVETYKKLGGPFVEGTNEEVERTRKYIGIFDEGKSKKTEKKAEKKTKKVKK